MIMSSWNMACVIFQKFCNTLKERSGEGEREERKRTSVRERRERAQQGNDNRENTDDEPIGVESD